MPKVFRTYSSASVEDFFALTFAVFLQGGVGDLEVFGWCV